MAVPAVCHGPVGQVALPSQEKPIPCTTTRHFYMSPRPRKSRSLHLLLALTHNSQPSVTHHHCTPCTSSSVIPLAPLSSILASLFSFPFRGLQLRTGRNRAWYHWLEGEDFWQEKTSGSGHLAQSEFTLGSPQLEIVSSLARVPQRPNKTLGKQQVSTR